MRAGRASAAPLPALAVPPVLVEPPGAAPEPPPARAPEPPLAPVPLEPPAVEVLPVPGPEELPAWFEPPEAVASGFGELVDSLAEQALANATDSAIQAVRRPRPLARPVRSGPLLGPAP
jgi:hypothetical protein